jgi:lipid A 3-O-deacylase
LIRLSNRRSVPAIYRPVGKPELLRSFRLCACVLVALAVAGARPAAADGFIYELKAGVLYHDAPDLWSGFQLEPKGVDINGEVIFAPSLPFLWGAIRPALGGSVNLNGGTSHAYLDARWQIEGPSGLFLGLGLGAAVHDGTLGPTDPSRKALGSRVLFHIPLEIGLRFDDHNSLSFYFEHTSNANTASYNEGLDRLGLRYGYRF